jgi:hypothetical protein
MREQKREKGWKGEVRNRIGKIEVIVLIVEDAGRVDEGRQKGRRTLVHITGTPILRWSLLAKGEAFSDRGLNERARTRTEASAPDQ